MCAKLWEACTKELEGQALSEARELQAIVARADYFASGTGVSVITIGDGLQQADIGVTDTWHEVGLECLVRLRHRSSQASASDG